MQIIRKTVTRASVSALAASLLVVAPAAALPTYGGADSSSAQTTAQERRLTRLKTRADAEIDRRLARLTKLEALINKTKKLSAADKATLVGEVNDASSGLTDLKTKIDGDTDLVTALADAKSIVTEYRIYLWVVPKVHLIAAADAQLAVEAKLTALATKLQTRITDAKNQGKDVSQLQSQLDNINQQISAARSLSTAVEQAVLPLQPNDFDASHSVLEGYRTKLQTAHHDNQAAYNDAKSIVQDLKKL